MTVPITSITIAGTAVDLTTVEYSIAISHGRNDVTDQAQASDAQITIRGFSRIPAQISDEITIAAYSQTRFTGRVTDLELSHEHRVSDNTITPVMVITAMGNLSKLALLNVGTAGYLEESLESRVAAIMDETGLPYVSNTEPMMVLLPADAGTGQPAINALTSLCQETGATLADLPSGEIAITSYTRRGYDYNPATWAYMTDPWTSYGMDWASAYQASASAPVPISLDPDSVVWEPIWRNNVLSIVNEVTVSYGTADPQATISASDATSIARHGLRSYNLQTKLADPYDALTRAANAITAQSEPRYDLQQLQVRVDLLDSTQRAAVLGLLTGHRVLVTDLPQPAPVDRFEGIVEGWAEHYSDNGHTLTLSLSDPRYSYALVEWIAVSPTLTWASVDPSIQWYNVVLPDDLIA